MGSSIGTLKAEEVPDLLKRPFVMNGYRPMHRPQLFYALSAFRSHNELVNVWTHFLPAVFFFYHYFWNHLTNDNPVNYPLLGLYTGIILLMTGSTLAHLLHSRSKVDHIFWFLIDFVGIAYFGLGIGVQRYTCASHPLGYTLDYTYVPLLLVVCLLGQFLVNSYLFVFHSYWVTRLYMRMFTSFILTIWLYIPLYPRYMAAESVKLADESLAMHSKAFYWLVLAGLFLGCHLPERFFPGRFDHWGYGHQLFHLCIIMVSWNLCEAASIDCRPRPANYVVGDNAGGLVMGTFLCSTVLIYVVVRRLMRIAVKKHW